MIKNYLRTFWLRVNLVSGGSCIKNLKITERLCLFCYKKKKERKEEKKGRNYPAAWRLLFILGAKTSPRCDVWVSYYIVLWWKYQNDENSSEVVRLREDIIMTWCPAAGTEDAPSPGTLCEALRKWIGL